MAPSLKLLLLIAAGLGSAFVTYASNGTALQAWRRARDQHWTERARRYFPARCTAANNLWVIPIVVCLSFELFWPETAPHWSLIALVSAFSTVLATVPMDREVFPRISPANLWRQVALGFTTRLLLWSFFLIAIALMPERFNLASLGIATALVGLLVWYEQIGGMYLGRKLGLLVEPPERLRRIVAATAAQMHVSYRELWVLRISFAQAYAIPGRRRLLFTERLLEILSDAEIAAACAHELAHLTEARRDYALRYLGYLFFLPWIFLTPTLHTCGIPGLFLLLGITLLVPFLIKKISHRLEVRADGIAKSAETDAGVYAQALARLYEDNLLPAVNPKKNATHPHLYDRLLAAGMTPDFPRPEPPKAITWQGTLFSSLMGALAVLVLLRNSVDQ